MQTSESLLSQGSGHGLQLQDTKAPIDDSAFSALTGLYRHRANPQAAASDPGLADLHQIVGPNLATGPLPARLVRQEASQPHYEIP